MITNNTLNISIFSKNISFYGISLDKRSNIEQKIILSKRMTEGLENNVIKPCRKIFERNEIETAFRYMASGKHIGKVQLFLNIHK